MIKTSKKQLDLLKLIGQHPKHAWMPPSNRTKEGYLESEHRYIFVDGTSSANAIKALWRKGLAIPYPKLGSYASKITEKGLNFLTMVAE